MGRDDRTGMPAPALRNAVACSPRAGVAFAVELDLAAGATAIDAVRASGLLERCPELAAGGPSIGIWGRAVSPGATLRDGDRVELYRRLTMDPQEARRLRARQARTAARR